MIKERNPIAAIDNNEIKYLNKLLKLSNRVENLKLTLEDHVPFLTFKHKLPSIGSPERDPMSFVFYNSDGKNDYPDRATFLLVEMTKMYSDPDFYWTDPCRHIRDHSIGLEKHLDVVFAELNAKKISDITKTNSDGIDIKTIVSIAFSKGKVSLSTIDLESYVIPRKNSTLFLLEKEIEAYEKDGTIIKSMSADVYNIEDKKLKQICNVVQNFDISYEKCKYFCQTFKGPNGLDALESVIENGSEDELSFVFNNIPNVSQDLKILNYGFNTKTGDFLLNIDKENLEDNHLVMQINVSKHTISLATKDYTESPDLKFIPFRETKYSKENFKETFNLKAFMLDQEKEKRSLENAAIGTMKFIKMNLPHNMPAGCKIENIKYAESKEYGHQDFSKIYFDVIVPGGKAHKCSYVNGIVLNSEDGFFKNVECSILDKNEYMKESMAFNFGKILEEAISNTQQNKDEMSW